MATNGEVVRGVYEALGRGDVAAVLGALDAEIEWWEADSFLYAGGNPYVGPQAVAKLLERAVTDVEEFAVVPERFIDAGDAVVVEGRYRGTVKATGTPVDAQFAHVWRLRDGKVTTFQQYTDTAQWQKAAAA